jgi:uncharacterized protein
MSNTFFQLNETYYKFLELLNKNTEHQSAEISEEFLTLLHEKNILTEEKNDKKKLMVKQYLRNCSCYNTPDFSITICPTLACNFHCFYCFEKTQKNTTVMSQETIDKLIVFIKKRIGSKKIKIDWYGGEPTLAFDKIQTITQRINNEGIVIDSARLVTNGYLLDSSMINELNDLHIQSVQITLDGIQEIHDKRRRLRGGKATFERIITNIDTLADSSYRGKCHIRVNIDNENMKSYTLLRKKLLERYKDKQVNIYASRVKGDAVSTLTSDEWTEFCLELYRQDGIISNSIFYPKSNDFGSCVANFNAMYVIGPNGEIYKCWEDVGITKNVIGNIYHEEPISNYELLAAYNIGSDPYVDEKCLDCRFLPICSEVCVKKRIESKFATDQKCHDYCTHFKNHLIPCLEEYYDIFLTAETSRNLLNLEIEPLSKKGYRIIQTEKTIAHPT